MRQTHCVYILPLGTGKGIWVYDCSTGFLSSCACHVLHERVGSAP